jgi:putative thioredoxin
LAVSYHQNNQNAKALDECFFIIKKEKRWNEEAARKLALQIIDALGPNDDVAKAGKRRLSNIWFM